MKPYIKTIFKYLPLLVGVTILLVVAPLVPWGKVGPYLADVGLVNYLLLFALGLMYYAGRILRYWIMLRFLDEPIPLHRVAIAVLVAQPVAVLPGGELYRSAMLKRYGDVAIKDGAPTTFAQAMAESVGLLIIALIGAAVLQRYVAVLLGLGVIFALIIGTVRWHDIKRGHKLLNKLPAVNVRLRAFRGFINRNRVLLSPANFSRIIAASYVSTAAGIGLVYVAAQAVHAPIEPFQAAIGYTLPVVLESVSFLPGGLGVHESSSASLFALFGASFAQAVAITLIVRLATLGLGFPLGFAAMGWANLRRYKRYD